MDKPDRVFLGPPVKRLPDGSAVFRAGDAYLATTPEREIASGLVEALRVYANADNWNDGGFEDGKERNGDHDVRTLSLVPSTIDKDHGATARAVLAKLEGK